LDRQERAIGAIDAAQTAAEVDEAVKLLRQRRKLRLLLPAGAAVLVAGISLAVAVPSHHDEAKATKVVREPPEPARVIAPRCPTFQPPAPPDVPVGNQGPEYKFEDGGIMAHSFFTLYHPRGFSAGPLYSQHYDLFRKQQPSVRIRIRWVWPTDATSPRPNFIATRRKFEQLSGFTDLGTTKTVFGCQWAIRWDYRRTVNGTRVRAIQYFFAAISRVQAHNGVYDVLFEAPAGEFSRWNRAFNLVRRSFRVNQGIENAEIHTG
jgi:hypothetical protein